MMLQATLLMQLLTLAAVAAPAAPDAYTPNVPAAQGAEPAAKAAATVAAPGTQEVTCNDPQTISDCYKQARQLCQGDYQAVKETDTDHKRGAPRKRSTIRVASSKKAGKADPGEQRLLAFTCGKTAPAAVPAAAQK